MSSVLIKGMKLPKECRDCPMDIFYINCGDTRCKLTNKLLAKDYNVIPFDGRPDWCPLVEVPAPHGDLIDIDSKITIGIKDGLKVTTVRDLLNDKAVRLPKTVIEAEWSESHADT